MRQIYTNLSSALGTKLVFVSRAVLLGGMSFGMSVMPQNLAKAQTQFPQPERLAPQVYEKLPEFPLENQYQFRKKKGIASDNTLIKRLIQYHHINRGRSPEFRLDWKITLADYLGVNEFIDEVNYPGRRILKPNPYESDLKVIQGLSQTQRNRLVQALVDVFASRPAEPEAPASPQPSSIPSDQAAPLPSSSSPESAAQQEGPPGQKLQPAVSESAADLLAPPPSPPPVQRDRSEGEAHLLLP